MLELSQCFECKHFQGNGKCEGFDNIPDVIYLNKEDHTTPYPGDNGIMFEEKEKV